MENEKSFSPIRETNNEARQIANNLISQARLAALAVIHPDTGSPFVSRIAIATTSQGMPLSLISDLSIHTNALKADHSCSLLLGEPGQNNAKGDPLNQARITLQCQAEFIGRDQVNRFKDLQQRYLNLIPKAKVYADFQDFNFVVFQVRSASLNGGFGKAFELTPGDLGFK